MKKQPDVKKIIAILLLVCLLVLPLTSSALGRYTSYDKNHNEARVASWGVLASAEGQLFQTKDSRSRYIIKPKDHSDANGLNIRLAGIPESNGELQYAVHQQNVFLAKGTWAIMKDAQVQASTYLASTYYLCENEQCALDSQGVYDVNQTYYTLQDEVDVTATYWPIVFTLSGEGHTTYTPNKTAKNEYNSLQAIETLLTSTFANQTFTSGSDLGLLYGLTNQNLTWEWNNCTDGTQANHIQIDNGSASLCEACKRDRMLQQLMLESESENHTVYVKGENESVYRKPQPANEIGNFENNDYHLFVNFDFDLLVKQVD